jgi:hypothetical protein
MAASNRSRKKTKKSRFRFGFEHGIRRAFFLRLATVQVFSPADVLYALGVSGGPLA